MSRVSVDHGKGLPKASLSRGMAQARLGTYLLIFKVSTTLYSLPAEFSHGKYHANFHNIINQNVIFSSLCVFFFLGFQKEVQVLPWDLPWPSKAWNNKPTRWHAGNASKIWRKSKTIGKDDHGRKVGSCKLTKRMGGGTKYPNHEQLFPTKLVDLGCS